MNKYKLKKKNTFYALHKKTIDFCRKLFKYTPDKSLCERFPYFRYLKLLGILLLILIILLIIVLLIIDFSNLADILVGVLLLILVIWIGMFAFYKILDIYEYLMTKE